MLAFLGAVLKSARQLVNAFGATSLGDRQHHLQGKHSHNDRLWNVLYRSNNIAIPAIRRSVAS
jgi:hypothetical protein